MPKKPVSLVMRNERFFCSINQNSSKNSGQKTHLRDKKALFYPKTCAFSEKIYGFYILIINVVRKIFKKVKKILARNQKSSTFAPAKREGETMIMKAV